jgi:glucan-binding YG repeat protein
MMTDCVYYGMAFGASGAAVENGWVLIDGMWMYVKDGELCSGVHLIDGVVYYFLPMYGY